MRYTVIEGASLFDLQENVNNYLSSGWKLQGGIFAVEIRDGYLYLQAMVAE